MVESAESADELAAPRAAEAGVGSRAFQSLAVVNFRYLLGGTAASSFAMWMEQIGQGWLVAQLTNSPFQLGLVQFIRGISIIFVSPFVGSFSDRVDRRLLASVAATVNGLGALAIAIADRDQSHRDLASLHHSVHGRLLRQRLQSGAPVPRVRRREAGAVAERDSSQRHGQQHGACRRPGDRRLHHRLQRFCGVLRGIAVLPLRHHEPGSDPAGAAGADGGGARADSRASAARPIYCAIALCCV